MAPFVFFLIAVGVFALILVTHARRYRAWEQFAQAHGLAMQGWYFRPAIDGRYRDASIRVMHVRRHGGRNNALATRYRVTVGAQVPAGFFVCREGLLQRIGKVIGFQDITVGNPELDDALSIKGDDMVRIVRLLRIPEVGATVLGMITAEPELEIGQSLLLEEIGFADPERLEHVLEALCELAHVLEAGIRQLDAEDGRAALR